MALDTEPEDVYVRVVDVGPGLCTVTRVPGPHFMVYDSGHWVGGRCLDAVTQLVGTHEIEILVLSHSDADHLGDGAAILKNFRVRQVWQTGDVRTTETWKKLNTAISNEAADRHRPAGLSPRPAALVVAGPLSLSRRGSRCPLRPGSPALGRRRPTRTGEEGKEKPGLRSRVRLAVEVVDPGKIAPSGAHERGGNGRLKALPREGLTATYRKGDRVALTGFFKTRMYQKDGETKQVRELVVTGAKLERMKIREQAA